MHYYESFIGVFRYAKYRLCSLRMPPRSFGTVPTPALVAPIEFSMRLADYAALGGHLDAVRSLADTLAHGAWHADGAPRSRRMLDAPDGQRWPIGSSPWLG